MSSYSSRESSMGYSSSDDLSHEASDIHDLDFDDAGTLEKACIDACCRGNCCFPRMLVRYPVPLMSIFILVPIIMAIIAFGAYDFNLVTGGNTFRIRDGDVPERQDGTVVAVQNTVFSSDLDTNEKKPERSVFASAVVLLYEDTSGNDNVFTKENIKKIRKFEKEYKKQGDWEDYCFFIAFDGSDPEGRCFEPDSIVSFFFPTVQNIPLDTPLPASVYGPNATYADITCIGDFPNYTICDGGGDDFLPGWSVEDTLTYFLDNKPGFLDKFVSPDFGKKDLTSPITKSSFGYGFPLKGYRDETDEEEEQDEKLTEYLVDDIKPLLDRGITSDDVDRKDKGIEVYFINEEILLVVFDDILAVDASLVIFSIIFVLIYMSFHTQSIFLSGLAMVHILLSFPVSYFLLRVIIGEEWFNFLNFLALFIVLGIGADDVFLFLDAWKQSALRPRYANSLEKRMIFAYRRSGKAMLITSITTSVAFYMNIISTIAPIRMFGVFTGSLIIFDYLLVISWFPCVVVMWHRYLYDQTWATTCTCRNHYNPTPYSPLQVSTLTTRTHSSNSSHSSSSTDHSANNNDNRRGSYSESSFGFVDPPSPAWNESRSRSESESVTSSSRGSGKGSPRKNGDRDGEDLENLRAIEKYFNTTFTDRMHKYRFFVLAFFVVLLITFVVFATLLKPQQEPAQFLPDNHPVQRSFDLLDNGFKEPPVVMSVSIVFGVDGINREGTDPNKDGDFGKPQWDKDFDLDGADAQNFFLDMCAATREIKDKSNGRRIVRQNETFCPLELFRSWRLRNNLTFPVEEDVGPALREWARSGEANLPEGVLFGVTGALFDKGDCVGFDKETGELRYVMMLVNTTVDITESAGVVYPSFEVFEDFVAEWKDKNPPKGMRNFFQTTDKWVQMVTEIDLVRNTYIGIFVSLAVAVVVIMVSTGNVIITAYSILCIIYVVASVMGTMVIIGWSLGIIEAVCLTILVGLAVDYVLHLANAYNESTSDTRLEKTRDALTDIGISIFSSLITTVGSAAILLGTTVLFFVKFGMFIAFTILFSGLASFFFFISLVLIAGPEGRWGDCAALCDDGGNDDDDDETSTS